MDPRERPKIVTLGDVIVEVAAVAAAPLARGSDTNGQIAFRQGGSAANVAREVARCGGRSVFVGGVGRDAWAGRLAAALAGAGVDAHLVATPAPTARIVALVEPSGERTFLVERAAADRLRAGQLRATWFAGAGAIHLPGYSLYNARLDGAARHAATPARRAAALARRAGAIVSVDLASRQPILDLGPEEAWSRVAAVDPDLLFANEAEAAAILAGRSEAELLSLAPVVVVKLGARGCRILSTQPAAPSGAPLLIEVAARPVTARDTTGAGDAFAAGFLVAWLRLAPQARHRPVALRTAALAGHRAARRLLLAADRPSILA